MFRPQRPLFSLQLSLASSYNRFVGPEQTRPLVIRFEAGWRSSGCLVEHWYQTIREHSSTRITSIQHLRSTEGPFFHEFLLVRLAGGCCCRLDRSGEGGIKLDFLRESGSAAFDVIQWFPEHRYLEENILRSSTVVAEVTFPREFDILDVLAVCYSIHQHKDACNYTLKQFNCYFLCSTVLNILARRAAPIWERMSLSQWGELLEEALDQALHPPPFWEKPIKSSMPQNVKKIVQGNQLTPGNTILLKHEAPTGPVAEQVHTLAFQEYLRTKIKDHASRVDRNFLGSAAEIYDSIEQTVSAVWRSMPRDFKEQICDTQESHAPQTGHPPEWFPITEESLNDAAPKRRRWRGESDFVTSSLRSSSSLLESSSQWSPRTKRKGRLFINFESGWRSASCNVEKWYQDQLKNSKRQQSTTHFVTIEHRRTLEAPFFHEFLLIPLADGSFYRIERTGIGSDIDAISPSGCVACDMIEWFPGDEYQQFISDKPSEEVHKLRFPTEFDILDVLAICYSIQQNQHARRYTLQRYNCYFFCSAILSIMARRVADWPSILASDLWETVCQRTPDRLVGAVQSNLWEDSIPELLYDCLKDVAGGELFRLGAVARYMDSDKLVHSLKEIDFFSFQGHIQQHIRVYAERVSRHQLGSAKRICQDVESVIAEIWNAMPGGFASNVTRAPADVVDA
ncbi:hypothetical protein FRC08_012423 [Ceratobasidium sp. 394]|nr:hypothetical protein FRC08_012423 [Ceratobasidium sp. 394]